MAKAGTVSGNLKTIINVGYPYWLTYYTFKGVMTNEGTFLNKCDGNKIVYYHCIDNTNNGYDTSGNTAIKAYMFQEANGSPLSCTSANAGSTTGCKSNLIINGINLGPQCYQAKESGFSVCRNGIDDDNDGKIDCLDTDCEGSSCWNIKSSSYGICKQGICKI